MSTFARYHDLLSLKLSDSDAVAVRQSEAQAIGYAWGRADQDGPDVDGFTFGLIYGMKAARFRAEEVTFMRPIRDVYEQLLHVRSDYNSLKGYVEPQYMTCRHCGERIQ
jgi:hypothetical protein